jgi:hypothetical protein
MMLVNFLWSKVTDLCQHNARILRLSPAAAGSDAASANWRTNLYCTSSSGCCIPFCKMQSPPPPSPFLEVLSLLFIPTRPTTAPSPVSTHGERPRRQRAISAPVSGAASGGGQIEAGGGELGHQEEDDAGGDARFRREPASDLDSRAPSPQWGRGEHRRCARWHPCGCVRSSLPARRRPSRSRPATLARRCCGGWARQGPAGAVDSSRGARSALSSAARSSPLVAESRRQSPRRGKQLSSRALEGFATGCRRLLESFCFSESETSLLCENELVQNGLQIYCWRWLTSQKAIWAPLQIAPISTPWGDRFLEWVSYK